MSDARKLVEGWKAIADAVGLSRSETQRKARLPEDRIPVWKYFGRVLAYTNALADWRERHMTPLGPKVPADTDRGK